jgi:hypothetical protein
VQRAAFAVPYNLSLLPVPLPSRVAVENGCLRLYHEQSESGYVLVPWVLDSRVCRVVESASLCDRKQPYRLMLELARGELHQLRRYVEEWTAIGLQMPEQFFADLRQVTHGFVAALSEQEPAAQDHLATTVLQQCSQLSDQLVREFTSQMLETRIAEEGRLATQLAAQTHQPLGATRELYLQACNAAHLAVSWRQVEEQEGRPCWSVWDDLLQEAEQLGLPITAGPLIDLSAETLPEWVLCHRGDLPTLTAIMCDYIETVVLRYHTRIQRWILIAGANVNGPVQLDDDQRLRLTHRLFTAALHVDPNLQMGIRLAQPWGDYISDAGSTISPLMFADDLLRSGLPLATLDLEMRFGSLIPRASWTRDLLDTVRLLELYEILGLPLSVTLAIPAQSPSGAEGESSAASPCPMWPADWGPTEQAQWVAALTAVVLCWPQVHAVTWECWMDRSSPHVPPLGLVDAQGQSRPLHQSWQQLRNRYLR